jgi:hypothetical protein
MAALILPLISNKNGERILLQTGRQEPFTSTLALILRKPVVEVPHAELDGVLVARSAGLVWAGRP